MKKSILFLIFFALVACYAKSNIMTEEKFFEVELGISENDLRKKLGPPDQIENISENEKRYKYIERIAVDEQTFEVRYYFFIIKNGKVKSKSVKHDNRLLRPLLERNAYDLQTSCK